MGSCQHDTDGDGNCAHCARRGGCLASKPDQIVHAVLKNLFGRAGFDAFWDEIQADVREEIRESLARDVSKVLHG